MNTNEALKERINEINNYLELYFNKQLDNDIPVHLKEAMKYSISAGGKRLRPILLIESARCINKDITNAIPLACAIEMIHTYSLIHDDLPAMDNDDYRRGKLTNHRMFGEAVAILAGDSLLNYSYEILLNHMENIDSNNIYNFIKASKELAVASGPYGMIGGQAVDIKNEKSRIDIETLNYINSKKTGALIRAAVRAGAIIQGSSEIQLRELTEYGEKIGLAFQIIDDILDIVGEDDKLGKKTGSDDKNHKLTYPIFYGIEKSKKIVEKLLIESHQHLDNINIKNQFLYDIATFICRRNY